MRLGIDITPLQTASSGGIGTATYHTLRALARRDDTEIVLYGRSEPVVPFSETPLDLGLELRIGRGPLTRAGNIAWLQYGLAPELARDRIDVFWGTRHVLPRNAGNVGMVATLYDFWYVHHPEQQPLINRSLTRAVLRSAVQDGNVLTAISDATANDARILFPSHAMKVRTVHLGVDQEEFTPADQAEVARVLARYGVSGRFVLALDVYNERKGFSAVLDAVARMGDSIPAFDVVAVGRTRETARDSGVVEQATRLGLASRVRFVGDVAHVDLRALYTGCAAFVYPSVYEGFGMPVLEAMACGAPVICSNSSSLPEVAGDAALTADPTSSAQLAEALTRVLGDQALASRLRQLGRSRAAEFTWEHTAAGMRAAFDDAHAARRR